MVYNMRYSTDFTLKSIIQSVKMKVLTPGCRSCSIIMPMESRIDMQLWHLVGTKAIFINYSKLNCFRFGDGDRLYRDNSGTDWLIGRQIDFSG